ncbi:hypothetical protein KKF91_01420 [Myxococcota bacterium]|nr:hypothetical protein [Myxococcota bacterium]MBU1429196.1 hypothetical protein [Myxococcota bacterium]MBU1899692.1 hypothetical protein [Myxococcota bacterium]
MRAPALLLISLALLLGCAEDEQYTIPCASTAQCEEGRVCREGRCVVECYLDSDCEGARRCQFQRCALPEAPRQDGGALFTPQDAALMDGDLSDASPAQDAAR